MAQEITKQWVNLCSCCSTSLLKLMELNTATCNKLAKENEYMAKLASAKNVNDMLSIQRELFNHITADSMEYGQKAISVWMDWLSDCNKQCTHMTDEITKSTPMNNMQKAMSAWMDGMMQFNKQFSQMGEQMMQTATKKAEPAKEKK